MCVPRAAVLERQSCDASGQCKRDTPGEPGRTLVEAYVEVAVRLIVATAESGVRHA
jgi:hypothetical protein